MGEHARFLKSATFIVALLAASQTGAHAQQPDAQGQRMITAFNTWIAANNIQNASLAIMRGDDVIGQLSHGSLSPTVAQPVASLSKAITGACAIKLAQDNRLALWAPIGQYVAKYWGTPIGPVAGSAFMTQQSGLTSDPTQGVNAFSSLDITKTNIGEQVDLVQNDPLGSTTFNYNNTNYAALGLIIESVTGWDYESACKSEVLTPMGVTTAELNPELRVLSSYGGWKISPFDYLKFLNVFRGSKNFFNRMMVWPSAQFADGSSYGPGVFMRPNGGDFSYWHSGSYTFTRGTDSWNFGAYFVMYGEGVRYVATYAPQPTNSNAVTNLDTSMSAAAFAVQPQAVPPAGR